MPTVPAPVVCQQPRLATGADGERELRHRDAGAAEVEVSNYRSAAALRIVMQTEDGKRDGSRHLRVINGRDVVIHAGNAGLRERKVQRAGHHAGIRAGRLYAHLAAELRARPALSGVNRRQGMVGMQGNHGA